jgi:hypothetical protein
MRRRLLLLSLLAASATVASAAEQSCPWLNSATAAGILGGPVTITMLHPRKDKDATLCEFASASRSILRIEVETMANPAVDFAPWLAQCKSHGQPVRGIGNEAIVCTLNKHCITSEEILSRVRNHAFLVRVTAQKTRSPTLPSSLREQAQTAAELVAGNLF